MPAGLPGDSRANNQGNPNAGQFVIFDPLSGPKGSPLDAKRSTGVYGANNVPTLTADPANVSTGALSTGIGIGANVVIGALPSSPEAIARAGFNDNMVAGEKVTVYAAPPPRNVVTTDIVDSTFLYIGGGRMIANPATDDRGVPFIPSPYTAGIDLLGAGNGGSRDAGAGPAFTGFPLKMVTAAGAVATGGAVEAGFANRSGRALVAGESTFGSDGTASAIPA